jgi:hypothetical protein
MLSTYGFGVRSRNGSLERLLSFDIVVKEEVNSNTKDYAANSILGTTTGKWYKIAVNRDGIYKLEKPFLATCGINTANLNPYANTVTVDSTSFIQNEILQNVITDTHFDNPDRKGRLVSFLARMYSDYGVSGYAIACDEYTAVCIDSAGQGRVFGGFPSYDDNAYFIQVNCELTNPDPEICSPGNALTWNHNGEAVKAFKINGNATGSNIFDLNLWESSSAGTWYNWSLVNGVFQELVGAEPNCQGLGVNHKNEENRVIIYPNPVTNILTIVVAPALVGECFSLVDHLGKVVRKGNLNMLNNEVLTQGIESGIYTVFIGSLLAQKIIVN